MVRLSSGSSISTDGCGLNADVFGCHSCDSSSGRGRVSTGRGSAAECEIIVADFDGKLNKM